VYGKITSATNGNLYFTTNDPCYFYEYNLTGTLGQISGSTWVKRACGTNVEDKAGQHATQGPNGTVLIGTAIRGSLFSYDPVANAIREYGVIDPPADNPTCTSPYYCYRYVYTLQADASYAYLGMRDANTNYWSPVMVRLSDGQQTPCFQANNSLPGL